MSSRQWCRTNRLAFPTARGARQKWISNYDGRFMGLIPIRQALAESRNAVAMWITGQIGIDSVLRTSRSLGVRMPLAFPAGMEARITASLVPPTDPPAPHVR
jgi:membrane peptidoglycan carboxypeptidase